MHGSVHVGGALFLCGAGGGGGVPSRRRADQHVVLGRAALGLHGHDAHAVAAGLGAPGAVQVHQPHALLTWKGHTHARTSGHGKTRQTCSDKQSDWTRERRTQTQMV